MGRGRYPTVEKAVLDWFDRWMRFRERILKFEVLPIPVESVRIIEEAGKEETKEAK
jgi:hypothetical protein